MKTIRHPVKAWLTRRSLTKEYRTREVAIMAEFAPRFRKAANRYNRQIRRVGKLADPKRQDKLNQISQGFREEQAQLDRERKARLNQLKKDIGL